MKKFTPSAAFFWLLFGLLPWAAAEDSELPSRAPNLVVIYADDLGYGDLYTVSRR